MSNEINEAGYQSLRNLIDSSASLSDQWDYIALRDDVGDEITRIQISADARAEWIHDPGSQELVVELVLDGTGDDLTVPVTISETASYDSATGGDELGADPFTDVTIEAEGDQVTIQHRIQVPEVTG